MFIIQYKRTNRAHSGVAGLPWLRNHLLDSRILTFALLLDILAKPSTSRSTCCAGQTRSFMARINKQFNKGNAEKFSKSNAPPMKWYKKYLQPTQHLDAVIEKPLKSDYRSHKSHSNRKTSGKQVSKSDALNSLKFTIEEILTAVFIDLGKEIEDSTWQYLHYSGSTSVVKRRNNIISRIRNYSTNCSSCISS